MSNVPRDVLVDHPELAEDYGEHVFEERRRHVRSRDLLGGFMAEATVSTLTSGAYQDLEDTDTLFEEELGGPFVETSEREELAFDDDGLPPEATAEPFPRSMGGLGDDDEYGDENEAEAAPEPPSSRTRTASPAAAEEPPRPEPAAP